MKKPAMPGAMVHRMGGDRRPPTIIMVTVTPGIARALQQIARVTGIEPDALVDDLLAEAVRRRLHMPQRYVP
ncbi:hypothetical protein [Paraburkholderia metrosideri]|uniref:Uncharacterized protein n=1 Tax=Paraburkholderia metrosideri TaxID=580937 RepID=A0ABN7I5D6_9BURK|nr:hypothetical protein [Paraburkholderia metrosideri]CAD6553509.1 hypothetical protein LMG28140_05310 [Paraburkholderia metrosideri]